MKPHFTTLERFVPGGGLAGLLERVQTVDGRLEVDSPLAAVPSACYREHLSICASLPGHG
jgi:hypothetical protein